MTKYLLSLFLALSCTNENTFNQDLQEEILYGTPPELEVITQVDIFSEPLKQPTDILFVIDNSCSMEDNVLDIASNMNRFFNVFEDYNLNYHIGVISASASTNQPDSGQLTMFHGYTYVSPQVPDGYGVLQGLTNAMIGYEETGIDALWAAISPNIALDNNAEFFRKGAPLHIIFMSDEEDQSNYITVRKMYGRLLIYSLEKEAPIYVSAIVHEVGSPCKPLAESYGTRYIKLASYFPGEVISICEEYWEPILEDLARYSIPDTKYEYPLSQSPVLDGDLIDGTVYVLRQGATIDYNDKYYYSENRNSIVILSDTLTEQDIVQVTYKVKQ